MAYSIVFDDQAVRQLQKLDKVVAKRIRDYLVDRVSAAVEPRALGKPLTGSRFGALWRYRVGDYRIICQIQDRELVVLVVAVGHRGEVYR